MFKTKLHLLVLGLLFSTQNSFAQNPIGCGDPTCSFSPPQNEYHLACESTTGGEEFYIWLESNGGASTNSSCGDIDWINNFNYDSFNGFNPFCEYFYQEVTFTAFEHCGNVATFTRIFESEPSGPIDFPIDISEMHFEGCNDNDYQRLYSALQEELYNLPVDPCMDYDVEFEVYESYFYDSPCVKVYDYFIWVYGNCYYDFAYPYDGMAYFTDTTLPEISQNATDFHTSCENQSDIQQSLDIFLSTNGGAIAFDDCTDDNNWNDERITWTNDFSGIDLSQSVSGHETVTFTASDGCGNSVSTSATFYAHKCLDGPQFFSSNNPTPYGDFNNNEQLAFETEGRIEADNTIGSGADIIYDSGYRVILNEGFEVKSGATFEAITDGCNPNLGLGGGCIADLCDEEVCGANASSNLSADGTECNCYCDVGYIDLGAGCVIECTNNNCPDGICVNNECVCSPGYCGSDTLMIEVISADGTSCSCECVEGYIDIGGECVVECSSTNCSDGVCSNNECICTPGWCGDNGSLEMHANGSGCYCVCDYGYYYNGTSCVKNCSILGCVNGTCNGLYCICEHGYEGEDCDILSINKFLGTWTITETCLPDSYIADYCEQYDKQFTFTIVQNGASEISVQIHNFHGNHEGQIYFSNLYAVTSGSQLQIDWQSDDIALNYDKTAGLIQYSIDNNGVERFDSNFTIRKGTGAGTFYCDLTCTATWFKN